jgi:hypothetical protein
MMIDLFFRDYNLFYETLDDLCSWMSEQCSPQITHMHGINKPGFFFKDGEEVDSSLFETSHKRMSDLFNEEMQDENPGSFYIFIEPDYFHHIVSDKWEVFAYSRNNHFFNIYAFVNVDGDAAIYLKLKYGSRRQMC